MAYYEDKVILPGAQSVIVCVPHEKYPEFIDAVIKKNGELMDAGFRTIHLKSLRTNVKTITKNALSYQNFAALISRKATQQGRFTPAGGA